MFDKKYFEDLEAERLADFKKKTDFELRVLELAEEQNLSIRELEKCLASVMEWTKAQRVLSFKKS